MMPKIHGQRPSNGRSEWEKRTSVPLTLNPRKFTLTAGSHTIRFRTRDANSILDAIVVTNDLAYVP
jgi:hypothetical protein